MPDRVRVLTDTGIEAFRVWLDEARQGGTSLPPFDLLTATGTSDAFEPAMTVARGQATTRLEFGKRLVAWLQPADARAIARNAGLWNWLSLYFIDDLAPADASGRRKLLALPHYVLDAEFVWTRAYRHLVRFAWMACRLHSDQAVVLLPSKEGSTRPIGEWGELSEQLGSSQEIFGSRAVVTTARRMFMDGNNRPRKGVRGSQGGSARRLRAWCNQVWLTFDIEGIGSDALVGLLPREFERWRKPATQSVGQRPEASPGAGAPIS